MNFWGLSDDCAAHVHEDCWDDDCTCDCHPDFEEHEPFVMVVRTVLDEPTVAEVVREKRDADV